MKVKQHFTIDDIKQRYEKTILPIIQMIKGHGGIIDEAAIPSFSEVVETMNTISPLNKEYLGGGDLGDIVERAHNLSESNSFSGEIPPSLKNLSRALERQATPRSLQVLRSNSLSPNPVDLLKRALEYAHKYELPLYPKYSTTKEVRGHVVGYFRKFGHMSNYNPEKWLENVKAYGTLVDLKFDAADLARLSEAFVAVQKLFDVPNTLGKLTQISVEEADIKARENNSKPGFGYPIFKSAAKDEYRNLSIKLAKAYIANPKRFGVIPSIGQWRGQQGTNVILDFAKQLYPEIDWDLELPTVEQYYYIIQKIELERGHSFMLLKSLKMAQHFKNYEKLPNSKEERELLVHQGMPRELLAQFKNNKRTTGREWIYKYIGLYPQIWEEVYPIKIDAYPTIKYSSTNKQRVVFAGSNFQARADQTYIKPLSDHYKQLTYGGYEGIVQASTSSQLPRSVKISNLIKKQKELQLAISGDDKSKFDNNIHMVFTALFPAMFITPLFKDRQSAAEYWKYSIISRMINTIITFDGVHQFIDTTDSGGTTTFHKGSVVSLIAGLFAESYVLQESPLKIMENKISELLLPEAAGDDYFTVLRSENVVKSIMYGEPEEKNQVQLKEQLRALGPESRLSAPYKNAFHKGQPVRSEYHIQEENLNMFINKKQSAGQKKSKRNAQAYNRRRISQKKIPFKGGQ